MTAWRTANACVATVISSESTDTFEKEKRMTNEEFQLEYTKRMHAIQTGIKIKLTHDSHSQELIDTLKHIRVGVDTVKAELGATQRLLVKKGVFTEPELLAAILEGLDDEVSRYEDICAKLVGRPVKLG
jgi:hypothetical protein